MENVVPIYRIYDLPWSAGAEQEDRFKKTMVRTLGALLLLAVVFSLLPVPEPDPDEVQEIPQRFARLVIEQAPPPPPPPVVREEPEPEPEPIEEPEPEPEQVVEAESEIRRSYRFIERNLSPLGSVEVVIRSKQGKSAAAADTVRIARELGEEVVEKFKMVKKALTLSNCCG